MKKIILLTLLVIQILTQKVTFNQCNCSQLTTSHDCETMAQQKCQWNNLSNSCQNRNQLANTSFCDSLPDIYCLYFFQCSFVDGKCTFFTGCSPFQKTTNDDCQSISQRCVTDGTHCIDLGECNTYLTKISCNLNINREFCYWDDNTQTCSNADTCDKLPQILFTDSQCRFYLSQCTTTGYGCVERGKNCSDQIYQYSCFWNQDMTVQCYWNGQQCVDKTCENASLSINSDYQCQQFSYFNLCIAKKDGGCFTPPKKCTESKSESTCIIDEDFQPCYWDGSLCTDLVCQIAPSNYTSNDQCSQFMANCITNGSGCVKNTICADVHTKEGCVQNSFGTPCFWNGTCKDKICQNAPSENNTHELCTSFMPTCTVNSTNYGCTTRTCSNAPSSIITNSGCEVYLPKNNCITKKYGGCRTNTKCYEIDIEAACLFDVNGKVCFWNTLTSVCVDKTCANAPYTDDVSCQSYLKTCTVNSTNTGCADWTCTNFISSSLCDKDFNHYPCVYNGYCYKKQCSLAPKSNTTHFLCQQYLESCTVNSEGAGCVQIPLVCSAITYQTGCNLKTVISTTTGKVSYKKCGWTGNSCVDWNCTFLATTNTQTSDCNAAGKEFGLADCVVNNSLKGCMDLPITCEARQNQDNCLQIRVDYPICVWNTQSNRCSDKTCTTASIAYTTGALSTFTPADCSKYLSFCTSNNESSACVKASDCQSYTSPTQCSFDEQNNQCAWDNEIEKCIQATCSMAPNSSKYQNDSDCQNYQVNGVTCTVIQNVIYAGCISKQSSCRGYDHQNECITDLSGNNCIWYNRQCWTLDQTFCANIKLSNYSTQNCESIMYFCKTNNESTACINKVCSDYFKVNGTSSCNENIASHSDCQLLDPQCTIINGYIRTCQTIQATCNLYTSIFSCTQSTEGVCEWIWGNCKLAKITVCSSFVGANDATCKAFNLFCTQVDYASSNTVCIPRTCESIQRLAPAIMTYIDCQGYSPTCSVNLTGSSCITARTCEDYDKNSCTYNSSGKKCFFNITCMTISSGSCGIVSSSILSRDDCQAYSQECTINKTGSACTAIPIICALYSVEECFIATEGECIVYQNACVKKDSCDQADPKQYTTAQHCSSFLSSCTVAVVGGCQSREISCNLYLSQIQCIKNQAGDACYWNTESFTCQDFICKNIIKTSTYSNHAVCYNLQTAIKCTVQALDGKVSQGCQEVGDCSTYSIEEQCKVNEQDAPCQWIDSQQLCQDKACSTADSSFNTHLLCQSYMSDKSCTVSVIIDNGGLSLIGCQGLATCDSYISSEQCVIDQEGNLCDWNDLECAQRSCVSAPQDYNTHEDCQNYLKICTVSPSGGCLQLTECENYTTQDQCVINQNGFSCYFDSGICMTKKCQNAPKTNKDEDCHSFSPECGLAQFSCRSKICEDFLFTTDVLCSNAYPHCTTNGINCVTRGTCEQAMSESGCVTQSDGQQCQWIQVDDTAYCTLKNCATAPSSLATEAECSAYYFGCTTKSGGGCIIKSTCAAADVSEACTIDIVNIPCFWDGSICRNKECSDYQGQSYKACQLISQACILGLNGYCATIQNCSDIKNQQSCLFGNDGPCLWITKYKNENGTFGACFYYKQCTSIAWQTDYECKLISDRCTTNGINCVPITSCHETNTNGGCVNGYDGPCIQINVNGLVSCQNFGSCSQISLQTHEECQKVNQNCTSNGFQCQDLQNCYFYSKEACHINSKGLILRNGLIESTGRCVWDSSSQQCRNQDCQDLVGSTNQICSAQLSKCTSYGGKCVSKQNCIDYNQNGICPSVGIDGICIQIGNCRLKTCSDITNINSCTLELQKCISDGTKCIEKANCSSYVTETSCHQGGLDGVCIYNKISNSCLLMQNCYDAWDNLSFCSAAKDRCVFRNSTCYPISCYDQYLYFNECTYYYDWKYSQIIFCKLENKSCIEMNPKGLESSNCLKDSQYSYFWNENRQICLSCFQDEQTLTFTQQQSIDCSESVNCLRPTISINQNAFQIKLSIAILSGLLII